MPIFKNDDEISGAPVDPDEALKAEQARADRLKGYLGTAGSVLDNFASVPSSYEMLYNKKTERSKPSDVMAKAAASIKDPMETKRKAMEYMKLKRGLAREDKDAEFTDYSRDRERTINTQSDSKNALANDMTSANSLGARAAYKKQGLEVSDSDSDASLREKYGPIGDWAKMSMREKSEAKQLRERLALENSYKEKNTRLEASLKNGGQSLSHEQEKEMLALRQAHDMNKLDAEGQQKLAMLEQQASASKSGGKQLPPDKVLAVNEGNSIPAMLKDIGKSIDGNPNAFGPVMGRLRGANPYDETAQALQSQVKAASQAFGRYMEGGVLRKEDEIKYEKMFPQPSDTPNTAKNKLAIVNKLLIDKQNSNVSALKSSGYDTSGVQSSLGEAKLPQVLSGKGDDGKVEVYAPDGSLKRINKSDLSRALAGGGRLKEGSTVGAK